MRLPRRLRLALSHLGISAGVILLCASAIIFIWYPPPLAQLEGISSILWIMAAVDAGAGPLCTLVAASPKKSRAELKRDLAVIGSVQLLALLYALLTVFVARPAYIVYNAGQFDVEHANELTREELSQVKNPAYANVPWSGPVYVEARFPDDEKETMRIVNSAVAGGPDIKDMPRYFESWAPVQTQARERAKAITSLSATSRLREKISDLLRNTGTADSEAIVIPINGKSERGTVVLRKADLSIIGIVPLLTP